MCPVDREQFRLDDYKLKLTTQNAQADRMWTRFNYFVTIEAALAGLIAVASGNQLADRAPWAALAGFMVSVVWWIVGARDRFLWRSARRNVEWAASHLRIGGGRLPDYKERPLDGYIPVGEHDPFAAEMHAESLKKRWPRFWVRVGAIGGVRDSRLAVTMIPMALPMCISVLWWLGFVVGLTVINHELLYLLLISPPAVVVLLFWRPGMRLQVIVVDDRCRMERFKLLKDLERKRWGAIPSNKYRTATPRLRRFTAAAVVSAHDGGSDDALAYLKVVRTIRKQDARIAIFVIASTEESRWQTELALKAGATEVVFSPEELAKWLGKARCKCALYRATTIEGLAVLPLG